MPAPCSRSVRCCLFIPAAAQADPSFPPLTGRVVDDAHLLAPDQVAALDAKLTGFEQSTKQQLVVATIPDLQGYDIADYGYRLGRAWGIGQKGVNNGVVLIIAPNEGACGSRSAMAWKAC